MLWSIIASSLIGGIGLLAGTHISKGFGESPKVSFQENEKNLKIVESCSELKHFWTPFYCFNGVVQTCLGEWWRSTPDLQSFREEYVTPDGGTLTLTWAPRLNRNRDNPEINRLSPDTPAPIIVIFPGICLQPPNNYAINLMRLLQDKGWNSVMVNWRGTLSPITSPRMYHFSDTGDVGQVLQMVEERFPSAPIIAIGYSMGANVLVKWLGEQKKQVPAKLIGCMSISNPYNMEKLYQNFDSISGRLIEKFYIKGVKNLMQMNENELLNSHLKESYLLAMKANRLIEIESGIVCKTYGFESVSQLLQQSNSDRYLEDVSIPLLCISAQDDPVSFLPDPKTYQNNPNIIFCTTSKGGHTAWIQKRKGDSWCDRVALQYMDALLNFCRPETPEPIRRQRRCVG